MRHPCILEEKTMAEHLAACIVEREQNAREIKE